MNPEHFISSCSTFVPSIIKIFQRLFVLQSKQEISLTQEGEITPKVQKSQVVILVCDISSGPVHYYQVSSKYSKECLIYSWHEINA